MKSVVVEVAEREQRSGSWREIKKGRRNGTSKNVMYRTASSFRPPLWSFLCLFTLFFIYIIILIPDLTFSRAPSFALRSLHAPPSPSLTSSRQLRPGNGSISLPRCLSLSFRVCRLQCFCSSLPAGPAAPLPLCPYRHFCSCYLCSFCPFYSLLARDWLCTTPCVSSYRYEMDNFGQPAAQSRALGTRDKNACFASAARLGNSWGV